MKRSLRRALLEIAPVSAAAMFVLVAGECEDDGGMTTPEPGTGTLRIMLDHTVGGEDLVNGTEVYTTEAGNDFNVTKLRYVISRVELESEDAHGRRRHVEGPEVFLRDAFDDESRVIEIADATEGEYTGLSFVFGMDEVMNTPDADYSLTQGDDFQDRWIDMNWLPQWGDGYHYMKLEGQIMTDGGRGVLPLATHLGRRFAQDGVTDVPPPVPPDDAAMPHFFPVELTFPEPIDLADGGTVEIQLVMDIANWYRGPNLVDLEDPACDVECDDEVPNCDPGGNLDQMSSCAAVIMMDVDVQNIFEENGSDSDDPVFSLGTITEVD